VKLGAHETLDYSVLLFCQLGPKIKMWKEAVNENLK
jgi:hypothetical protein